VIGKGITRFHCIYWPAMLLSAGLPLPNEIFVHGYVTVDGQKISKSLGNTVDPVELVNKYGAEPVRYYLLREIPAWEDGDYSEAKFKQRYESDLANGLGNTFSRVTNMVEKYGLPAADSAKVPPERAVQHDIDNFQFDVALGKIFGFLRTIDQEIEQTKPWQLAKEGNENKVQEFLNGWVQELRQVGKMLAPFMPETSQKITAALRAERITKAEPLFPRLI